VTNFTGGDLISLLFHPQAQIKSLQAARLKLIRRIEEKNGWRVITMIHRQERIGFLGSSI